MGAVKESRGRTRRKGWEGRVRFESHHDRGKTSRAGADGEEDWDSYKGESGADLYT